jgi:hypothetical protein
MEPPDNMKGWGNGSVYLKFKADYIFGGICEVAANASVKVWMCELISVSSSFFYFAYLCLEFYVYFFWQSFWCWTNMSKLNRIGTGNYCCSCNVCFWVFVCLTICQRVWRNLTKLNSRNSFGWCYRLGQLIHIHR